MFPVFTPLGPTPSVARDFSSLFLVFLVSSIDFWSVVEVCAFSSLVICFLCFSARTVGKFGLIDFLSSFEIEEGVVSSAFSSALFCVLFLFGLSSEDFSGGLGATKDGYVEGLLLSL